MVVIYCLEGRKIRSQHISQGPIIYMAKYHFYALQKHLLSDHFVMSLSTQSNTCNNPGVYKVQNYTFIFYQRWNFEKRKTLFSCYFLVCFISDRDTLFYQFKGSQFFTHLKKKGGKKGGSKVVFLHTCKFLWLLLSWKHFKCQTLIRNSRLLSSICAWFYQVDLPGSVDHSCRPGAHIPCQRANHSCLPTGTLDLIKYAWHTSVQHTCMCKNSISSCTDR